MLVLYLMKSGYDVTCTQSPSDALLLAKHHSYDLILIDNWMPEMNGAELTRQIRKFDSLTPILFYSGADYESDTQDAQDSGAQGYLVKPGGIYDLVNEVARLIADSRLAISTAVDLPLEDSTCAKPLL